MKEKISDEMLETLDEISVLRLELVDELINHKKEMESFLREGYFMLGKSRYILGVHAVSMLQVPTDECIMTSVVSCHASEEILHELPLLKNYQYSIIPTPKANTEEKSDEEDNANLRKRGTRLKEANSSSEDDKKPSVTSNPINWFSGLPPQSLRKAQEYFKQAILKSAECATVQSKLNALNLKEKEFS